MSSSATIEGKAKTQGDVRRLLFCLLAILLELGFILLLVTVLNQYAPEIELLTRIAAVGLVLYICDQNKTSAVKMPWIILILVAPILGVCLYLLIGLNSGTRKMRRRFAAIDTLLFRHFPEQGDLLDTLSESDRKAAGIARYIASSSGYPIYRNTDIAYYDDAAKGLEAQLAEMKKAERFIFMEYHAIENEESWKRIQDVLVERAEHGVEVRVFYDDMGSIGFIDRSFADAMQALGINCRVFNPFVPGLNMFLNNRDHRKITVIDGKVGFTGGYNLANEYFNVTHPYGEWKDTGIRLEGDAVRSLTITFLEMWNAIEGTDRTNLRFDDYFARHEHHAAETGYIQPYAFGPMNEERVGENIYISMVEKAEKYCWFTTPYLIITDEMNHALKLAARRGVDVRIITPGIPDKKMIYRITRSFYADLALSGVRIFEWVPGFCHAKMSIADDTMATCGTINLDYRSLYHHFENGCFMVDCAAVREMKADFEATFAQCMEVTDIYRSELHPVHSLRTRLLRLFAALM